MSLRVFNSHTIFQLLLDLEDGGDSQSNDLCGRVLENDKEIKD